MEGFPQTRQEALALQELGICPKHCSRAACLSIHVLMLSLLYLMQRCCHVVISCKLVGVVVVGWSAGVRNVGLRGGCVI